MDGVGAGSSQSKILGSSKKMRRLTMRWFFRLNIYTTNSPNMIKEDVSMWVYEFLKTAIQDSIEAEAAKYHNKERRQSSFCLAKVPLLVIFWKPKKKEPKNAKDKLKSVNIFIHIFLPSPACSSAPRPCGRQLQTDPGEKMLQWILFWR